MYQYRQPPAIDTNPFSSYNNSYNSGRSSTFLGSPSATFASPTLSRMSSPGTNPVVAQRSSTWQDKLEGPLLSIHILRYIFLATTPINFRFRQEEQCPVPSGGTQFRLLLNQILLLQLTVILKPIPNKSPRTLPGSSHSSSLL